MFYITGESECPLGYILNGKYCYGFKEHSETWTNAQQYCNKDQANLVSFETAEEAEFIAGQYHLINLKLILKFIIFSCIVSIFFSDLFILFTFIKKKTMCL